MRSPFLVVLLLVAVGFAGCVNEAINEAGGSDAPGIVVVEDDTGQASAVVLANGTGAVAGTVTDDAGTPIPEAGIALLGTSHSARANATGRFEIINVTAGLFTMRVDHPDFNATEEEVLIESGKVTRLQIILLPRFQVGAGYRPHLHDYWAGQTSLIVMDRDYDYHQEDDNDAFSEVYDPVTQWAGVNPCVWEDNQEEVYFNNRRVEFGDPFQLVWQGTSRFEAVVSWSSTDYIGDKVTLAWKPANTTKYTQGAFFKSGETYTIDVQPPMWDASHQGFSLWDFFVCVEEGQIGSLDRLTGGDATPHAFLGRFHIKLTMFRGHEILPEQAHPNFWVNGTERVLFADAKKTFGATARWTNERTASTAAFSIVPPDGNIVPPGSGAIMCKLSWSYAGPLNQKAWSLTYRPGNINPRTLSEPGQLSRAEPTEKAGTSKTYVIPVQPDQTDAFYQKRSLWLFYLNYEGEESSKDWMNTSGGEITVVLGCVVSKDPAYS